MASPAIQQINSVTDLAVETLSLNRVLLNGVGERQRARAELVARYREQVEESSAESDLTPAAASYPYQQLITDFNHFGRQDLRDKILERAGELELDFSKYMVEVLGMAPVYCNSSRSIKQLGALALVRIADHNGDYELGVKFRPDGSVESPLKIVQETVSQAGLGMLVSFNYAYSTFGKIRFIRPLHSVARFRADLAVLEGKAFTQDSVSFANLHQNIRLTLQANFGVHPSMPISVRTVLSQGSETYLKLVLQNSEGKECSVNLTFSQGSGANWQLTGESADVES